MEYYTYVLIDPRNSKIFYVGKGQKKRMYNHVNEVRRGRIPNGSNKKLGNKIKKILSSGHKVKYKKIFITENEQEAFNKEKELIAEIKLENLCNLTYGGEGGIPSEETKRKMSESHKNQSSGMLNKYHTEETKKKISTAMKDKTSWIKGNFHTEETKRKISESSKGKQHTEETKKKISNLKKGNKNWLGKTHSEESRRKMSNAKKGKSFSDDHKRKLSESHRKNKNKLIKEYTK